MLNNLEFPKTLEYSSDGAHLPIEFFMLTVPLCKRIDLKLGYFSSNAIRTLAYGFAQFIHNGGQLRIITNHFLSVKDKLLISDDDENSLAKEEDIKYVIENDLEGLAKILENGDQHFFDCLKYLLKHDKLQIIPVKLKPNKLAHFKQGIFDDGTNQVYFNGSCNFTAKGLVDNGESLSIARSWGETSERLKVKENIELIEKIWNKDDSGFEYLSPDQIIEVIYSTGKDKDLDELIDDEVHIYDKLATHPKLAKSFKNYTQLFKQKVELEKHRIKEESQKPKFPYGKGAREYQNLAFENWKNNKQQGLFAMATGTGKTITSLNCLLEIYKKTGYYKALILVPTITLVDQWDEECKRFNFKSVVKVCSKSSGWKNDIAGILLQEKLSPTEQVSFIVISTYASFARSNIFAELNQLSPKTLLVADECHNMGSVSLLKLLPKVNCKRRIGLSATPERQFDEEGNNKLFAFFNSEKGYTYEFPMNLAINGDIEKNIEPVLCRYYYYPYLVALIDSEMNDYLKLSLKIAKYFNPKKGGFDKNDPILTALLLARKRIIHKAFNKVSVFRDIINQQYIKKGNLKYTLVYVPEGNDPNDYFETDLYSQTDETENDNEAVHLIDVFTSAVKDIDKRTTVRKFISGTNLKDDILEQFANGDIDVLTSMKCLDEGVDVPRAELAIFCASTGNPRQFVQRRGRILRQHPDKKFAYIHDLVVIPEVNPNSDSYEMERSMLKKELERVNNFASLSENSSHTIDVLLDTMNHYNLNLYHNE